MEVLSESTGASSVLDLFSGTARVGHALKAAGWRVVANDHNAYAHALARCHVEADAEDVLADAKQLVSELNALPGSPGWFTETYCVRSRFLHPRNGARIEAIRNRIEELSLPPVLEAVMITALMEAADRVDSTTGVQMAFLKSWAPRSLKDLELRVPAILQRPAAGPCRALRTDALAAAAEVETDVAYLDPPYNQHSYLGNYHVWETLTRWDQPETYGLACKRVDCRERTSDFNSRRRIHGALRDAIERVRAPHLVVSFSDEGAVTPDEIATMLAPRGDVVRLDLPGPRYVGAKIGIHDPKGRIVGRVGRLHNVEHLFLASPDVSALRRVAAMRDAMEPVPA